MPTTSTNSGVSVPRHAAIIMDGNGRWAKRRGHGRTWGHRKGAKRVDEIVTACRSRGVEFLTLYVFSSENWARPRAEVQMLMRLLVQHLRTMDKKLLKNGVRLTTQGELEKLPPFVSRELERVKRMTDRPDAKMTLNLALSYGGRQEILMAARDFAQAVKDGVLQPESLDEALLRSFFYHPEIPDPDLLIRTGGEYRVSNFLLWQIAYAEFYVTETLWPDFGEERLDEAFAEYGRRERRFGMTSEQVSVNGPRAQTQPGVGP